MAVTCTANVSHHHHLNRIHFFLEKRWIGTHWKGNSTQAASMYVLHVHKISICIGNTNQSMLFRKGNMFTVPIDSHSSLTADSLLLHRITNMLISQSECRISGNPLVTSPCRWATGTGHTYPNLDYKKGDYVDDGNSMWMCVGSEQMHALTSCLRTAEL